MFGLTATGAASDPLPRLRGRAREEAYSTARARGKSPLPNPPPQAEEGIAIVAGAQEGFEPPTPSLRSAFRRSRPLIPTDRDHLFRSIATSAARGAEGAVG